VRILVRAPNWIGDQVLAYPFFHHLRRAYPKAHIAAACVPWVSDLMFRSLIDETHVLPRPLGSGLKQRLDAIERGALMLSRAGPWDLGVSLPNSLSSAWLLYRAGAKRRRGYAVDGRGWLLNERIAWDGSPSLHRAQAYQDLIVERSEDGERLEAREFWGTPPENDLDPGISPEAWSDACGTIPWEILCGFKHRLPRLGTDS
jgi:ADP-heptose:LPS heptosyltransferase